MLPTRIIFVIAAASGPALADFRIGNCASSKNLSDKPDANEISLPGSNVECDYRAYPDGSDICNATTLNTQNDGGVCPGNNKDRSLSFCNIELFGSNCPASFQIDPRDDCGDKALKDSKFPEDGYFYGNLINTAKNSIQVGRCVYEVEKTDNKAEKMCKPSKKEAGKGHDDGKGAGNGHHDGKGADKGHDGKGVGKRHDDTGAGKDHVDSKAVGEGQGDDNDDNEDDDETTVCATFIRCYTAQYGTTEC